MLQDTKMEETRAVPNSNFCQLKLIFDCYPLGFSVWLQHNTEDKVILEPDGARPPLLQAAAVPVFLMHLHMGPFGSIIQVSLTSHSGIIFPRSAVWKWGELAPRNRRLLNRICSRTRANMVEKGPDCPKNNIKTDHLAEGVSDWWFKPSTFRGAALEETHYELTEASPGSRVELCLYIRYTLYCHST